MTNNEVKVAFDKYDADGSGAIDKDELAQLSKELGHELTGEELEKALKDLDLNGDGVIDMKEFSRWWFTGKKEFNGSRRKIL
jgi:Ca2+-binding EF-hand superfamily protein